ncbi:hypothetical protein [Brevundimonas sp. SL130]|uniref:hypothetical protein n=1 Tax=Brevundimonas sp. SL130 TaxID=2995143 RepID=UPI00226D3AC4|nr:hypothetical protein [Brevundimonas sp. SL130]WAC59925.1 hypothetical protein OU998_00335 [Brevundimonas sp. SL130]
MSKLKIALWAAVAAFVHGTFRTSFPPEWGGQPGLFALVVVAIPTLAWTIEYVRRQRLQSRA